MAAISKPHVGFFGIAGSFTHKAAKVYFGNNAPLVPNQTFRNVFDKVSKGMLDFGVVPIENTLAGSVYENYDLLEEYGLCIVGESSARVTHSLLVAKSASGNNKEILTNLRKVYSHEKTLVQCSNFFKQHPWIEAVPYTNTADAAKLISGSHDPSLGALADIDNAELYKLRVIRPDVENNKYNYTRFIVISKNASADPTDDKCSLMLRLPHLSGSLSTILTLLTKQDCNLTKIESRLLESAPLEYTFYLDFTFEGGPEKLKTTLEKLKDNVVTLHVFGSYRDERTTALTR